ncbi:hypothetical protein MSG28_012034 [Choristoneura fumiferana]|uniref:Uncharacterized protein n=1 Tax=Choristoneura fumiferana TaxID=7141 RepID=A0ACC0KML2_CHOFU|nr:hypothetical protein MSG28_012034 [Choristoneura fumiferana]
MSPLEVLTELQRIPNRSKAPSDQKSDGSRDIPGAFRQRGMLVQIVLTALTATVLAPCVLQRACPTRAPRPPSSVCMHRFEGPPYASLCPRSMALMLVQIAATLLAAVLLAPCVLQRVCPRRPPRPPAGVCMHRFKKPKYTLKNLRIRNDNVVAGCDASALISAGGCGGARVSTHRRRVACLSLLSR